MSAEKIISLGLSMRDPRRGAVFASAEMVNECLWIQTKIIEPPAGRSIHPWFLQPIVETTNASCLTMMEWDFHVLIQVAAIFNSLAETASRRRIRTYTTDSSKLYDAGQWLNNALEACSVRTGGDLTPDDIKGLTKLAPANSESLLAILIAMEGWRLENARIENTNSTL